MTLRLGADGAELHPEAAQAEFAAIVDATLALPQGHAGVRIHGNAVLRELLDGAGSIGRLASGAIGLGARPVRALLFDKSPETNWALGWHQDRTIAVRERIAAPGFGPWTRKQGMTHVEPPFALIERMVTLRIHLDPVPRTNAPLLIAPGSHRLGKLPEPEIDAAVQACGLATCIADAGDVRVYATPILHASERTRILTRRRVLQVDYSAHTLPAGLEWLGI